MTFPFWKFSLPSPVNMFIKLKDQEINIEDENIVIRQYPEDYESVDHISNHFTESVRIYCRFGDFDTPFETWEKIKNNVDYLRKNKHDKREYIYSLTRECNTFNPTFCLYIISKLVGKNSKILDPSSGWGDRLIASLASDANLYLGFDPNKKLQKSYNKIIKVLGNNDKEKYKVIPEPFEDVKRLLSPNYYDIAITSPPYYDLEIYDSSEMQSVVRNKSFNKWIDDFYYPYLANMIYAIKVNGYVVIYIEDIKSKKVNYPLRSITLDYMNNNDEVTYYNMIGLKVGKTVRWALIWKKIKESEK